MEDDDIPMAAVVLPDCRIRNRAASARVPDLGRSSAAELLMHKGPQNISSGAVHPAWSRLMRYCAELGHGEIEKFKIQDGLRVIAEVTIRKRKFSP